MLVLAYAYHGYCTSGSCPAPPIFRVCMPTRINIGDPASSMYVMCCAHLRRERTKHGRRGATIGKAAAGRGNDGAGYSRLVVIQNAGSLGLQVRMYGNLTCFFRTTLEPLEYTPTRETLLSNGHEVEAQRAGASIPRERECPLGLWMRDGDGRGRAKTSHAGAGLNSTHDNKLPARSVEPAGR